MSTLFKSAPERQIHYTGLMDSFFSVDPYAKLPRKLLGKLSRQVTDNLGIPNTTIPGFDMTSIMEQYAIARGMPVSYRLSKTGRKLNFTIG